MRKLGAFILIVMLGVAIGGLIKAAWPKKQVLISNNPDWYKQYPIEKQPPGCDPKKADAWYLCYK